MQKEVGVLRRL